MQALRAARARLRAHREARRAWIDARPVVKTSLAVLFWLPLAACVSQYGFTVKAVYGRSMQPTLNPDDSPWRDVVLFDRFSVAYARRYERGDVVALKSPVDSKLVVKRIVALEGDVVKTLPPYPHAEVCVPQGHAWVEGDEPFRTEDSNRYGPVSLGLIKSRLAFILWPWNRMGPLGQPLAADADLRTGTPGWRRSQADRERAEWRASRVQVTPPQSPSVDNRTVHAWTAETRHAT
ncbi:LexA/Signal peptidase [Epithele typhae]|uniref:LexA/Signal peptidase n=1 Tax=Epithele typhae TaxID=378194 RepID=UPI002007F33A|nr:LexA/Signal peptidase [Epithele typhae]KAH9943336.1 LexA/Signal peptidase [Epithele typhae]